MGLPCFWDEGIVCTSVCPVGKECPTCLRPPELLSISHHWSVSGESSMVVETWRGFLGTTGTSGNLSSLKVMSSISARLDVLVAAGSDVSQDTMWCPTLGQKSRNGS